MKIEKTPTAKWNLKNTEFIIRLLTNTTIAGSDVEQATEVMIKFKQLHQQLLSYQVTA